MFAAIKLFLFISYPIELAPRWPLLFLLWQKIIYKKPVIDAWVQLCGRQTFHRTGMCGHMVDRVVTGQDSAVTIRRELLKDGNYAFKGRQSCQRTSKLLDGVQSGNGAVTSGQSCHRKGMFCHLADRVHMTGLVLSHGEQSCNRTWWCCHLADRVVTGRECQCPGWGTELWTGQPG